MSKRSFRQGFTIIEVVLVLAIAGLIFLMVFVALPALQRSQRDTQRRNDMSRVNTALTQYITNHSSSAIKLPVGPVYYKPARDGGEEVNMSAPNVPDRLAAKSFVLQYMNSGSGNTEDNNFRDPDGTPYTVFITQNIAGGRNPSRSTGEAAIRDGQTTDSWTIDSDFDNHVVYIIPGARCQGEDFVRAAKDNYAILYRLEGAGVFCIDDQ